MDKVISLLKALKDPHGKKIKRLKKQYQELDELSNVAVEIGDVAAYRSLQTEMREVFFDYLTAIAVDAIYSLLPHILIIWLISMKWKTITLPVVDWEIHIFAAYLMAYVLFYFAKFCKGIWVKFRPRVALDPVSGLTEK